MRALALPLLALFAACAGDPAVDDDVVGEPVGMFGPPSGPVVEVGAVVPGQPLRVTLSGVPTNTSWGFRAGGRVVTGSCAAVIANQCVDIPAPAAQATGTMPASGVQTLSLDVPGTLATGGFAYVQVAGQTPSGAGGTAPAVKRRIGCGDALVGRNEACDDGNVFSGDGCSALCQCEGDGDGDGVCDAFDGCPTDADKDDPGACGCGNPEDDGDGDGTPDCVDPCPLDELDACLPSCDGDEVVTCDLSGCLLAVSIGDGFCDPELDCEANSFDGGDCAVNCGVGELLTCDGTSCLPDVFLGDGACDEGLFCGRYGNDAGDCLVCAGSEVLSCDGGSCVDVSLIGDGTCDPALDCATHGDDGGDCLACSGDEVVGCDGVTCVPQTWLGDGECDIELDCEATLRDLGDCGCTASEIEACDGSCVPAGWLGDGSCDAPLDCAEAGFDSGDCVP